MFNETPRDLQMFAAVIRLVGGISLEALLKLKVGKSIICLVSKRRRSVSIINNG
jgi:hypothetical protein